MGHRLTQISADKFAQDARGDQNVNGTSLLVSSPSGPNAPNALSIGRLRLAELLERTKDLRGFLWILSVTLATMRLSKGSGREKDFRAFRGEVCREAVTLNIIILCMSLSSCLSSSADADFSIRGHDEAALPAFYLFGLKYGLNSSQKGVTARVAQSNQKKTFMTPRGLSSNV